MFNWVEYARRGFSKWQTQRFDNRDQSKFEEPYKVDSEVLHKVEAGAGRRFNVKQRRL